MSQRNHIGLIKKEREYTKCLDRERRFSLEGIGGDYDQNTLCEIISFQHTVVQSKQIGGRQG